MSPPWYFFQTTAHSSGSRFKRRVTRIPDGVEGRVIASCIRDEEYRPGMFEKVVPLALQKTTSEFLINSKLLGLSFRLNAFWRLGLGENSTCGVHKRVIQYVLLLCRGFVAIF